MQALVENTTVKLNIEHNISSNRMIDVRFDLNQTILAVKENIESRYGSLVSYMKLQLKDQKGILKAELIEDMKTLGYYGADCGMIIYVIDMNPNSIHKQIESFEGVQKYNISEQDYDKLPQNFRKWKKQLLINHPQLIKTNKAAELALQASDPDYLSQLADTIETGNRCKLQNGARGVVAYVGKIVDKGPGYFIGVKLDQPYGDSNGIVKGVKYFDAADKYAAFVRPNQLQVGDFPELDIDDEI